MAIQRGGSILSWSVNRLILPQNATVLTIMKTSYLGVICASSSLNSKKIESLSKSHFSIFIDLELRDISILSIRASAKSRPPMWYGWSQGRALAPVLVWLVTTP